MRRNSFRATALALALAIAPASNSAGAESAPPRARVFAELSAGPLFGIDRPLKGCSLDALIGLGLAPFELGIRGAGAYEAALEGGNLRFDFELGLGSGLRAIVGGLLLRGEPALPDSRAGEARLAAAVADWPNRFGIAATIAELPWRPFRAALGLEAELVYTAFRVKAENALYGAAAFAAGAEARIALRLRWGSEKKD
jgi:hypothetical protein